MDLRLSEAVDQAADALEWLFGSRSTADSLGGGGVDKIGGEDLVDLVNFVKLIFSFARETFNIVYCNLFGSQPPEAEPQNNTLQASLCFSKTLLRGLGAGGVHCE